jgi:hypothetical protein
MEIERSVTVMVWWRHHWGDLLRRLAAMAAAVAAMAAALGVRLPMLYEDVARAV